MCISIRSIAAMIKKKKNHFYWLVHFLSTVVSKCNINQKIIIYQNKKS